MGHVTKLLPLATAVVVLGVCAPAGATSTRERTISPAVGAGFDTLRTGPGEGYRTRSARFGRPQDGRARRRRSIINFGQFSDSHVVDEMSPARVDFLDGVGGALRSSHRPQEAMSAQVFDRSVRAMNAARRSTVRGRGGRRSRMALAITTGDLTDNQQLNEARWFDTVLDGGRVDPFSGTPTATPENCPDTSAETLAKINADAAARRYTGVQDYDDYPGQSPDRYAAFYDPDVPPPGASPYSDFPRYPGLLDRAQRPFTAAGLDVPGFVARGNHDGLVQGNAPAQGLLPAIVSGCLRVFPDNDIDPTPFATLDEGDALARLTDGATLQQLLDNAGRTAPDADRRFVGAREYKRIVDNGFQNVERRENRRSSGAASYYGFTRRGVRFLSLDTVAEGGGQSGNLDDPQYRWLQRQLRTAQRRGLLVVAYGHHTLATLDNARTDEQAGECAGENDPGCDRDGRRSTPIHRGLVGRRSVRSLFLANPNLVAYVAGHTHANDIRAYRARGGRSGFWQVNTASHIDPPQQARTLEMFDNRDGTLSLFTTLLDHESPVAAPPAGTPAEGLSDVQLASLSRLLSFNDPQPPDTPSGRGAAGRRADRNVELVLFDPRVSALSPGARGGRDQADG